MATPGSSALKGSSSKYISALEYNALAKLILAFYPPDIFIPRSPNLVSDPSSKHKISSSNSLTLTHSSKCSWSNSIPKVIFSLTEAEKIKGSYST